MRRTSLFLLTVLGAALPAAATPTSSGDFQCYELKPASFDPIPVTVRDRFGTLTYPLRFPHRLCAPVGDDPGLDRYLMGYKVDEDGPSIAARRVTTRFGSLTLDLLRPDLLMIPTTIEAPPAASEPPSGSPLQCYRVDPSAGSPQFVRVPGVRVTDGLETVVVDLVEPHRLCVPASLDDAVEEPSGELLCYTTDSASGFGDERIDTQNRFGQDQVRLIHRRELCVPVLGNVPTTTTTSTTTSTTTTTSSTSTTTTTTTISSTSTTTTTTSSTTSSSTTATTVPPTTTTSTAIATTTTTTVPDRCGDGVLDAGEECDDGNRTGGDCCAATCTLEADGSACGDDAPCNGDERCRSGHCETAPACRGSVVLAAVTNFRGNTVSLIDPGSGRVEGTVPGRGGPWGVAFHPAGHELWITNRAAKSISVVDVATRTVSGSIAAGRTPLGITFDGSGARAFVASYGGDRIEVIDTASRQPVGRFAVDRGPSGLAFDPASDTLWVTCYGADTLLALDPATGEVHARLRVGRKPTQLALDAPRGRLFVSSFGAGSVTAVDLARRAVVDTIRVGRKPFGVAVDPVRARAYVTNAGQDTVVVIDTVTNAVVERRHVAAGPLGVGVDPAGRVLVTSGTAGVVSFLDPAGSTSSALVVGDLPVAFGSFVGTVGTRCPAAAEACVDAGAIVPGPAPLVALLEAMAGTIRATTPAAIPDATLAQEMADAVARGRDQAIAGQGTALRRELRGVLRTLRRAVAHGDVERATGTQLLDLARRARALALRS